MTPAILARARRPAALLGVLLAASGCATSAGTVADERDPDPFEPLNRAVYRFNDWGDRWVARPLATAYGKATPRAFRAGANNFLDNLRYPITIVNDFLQGKWRQGAADTGRFAINSVVGLGGIFDPATEIGLRAHDEDFGQTFSVWGLPEGPYLMVPVFGPYTASSAIGDLAGTQVSLLVQVPEGQAAVAFWVWYLVQERYNLIGLDEQVREAFDPYLFVRDTYLQNRRYKIHDGNPPEEELFPEDEFGEE
jgi:phospholipid-binding lipoprotein MlaA